MYPTNVQRVIDNVRANIGDTENRQNCLTIRCNEPGTTSAVLTVADEELTITTLPADVTPPTAIDLDLDLTAYSNIYTLVDAIETVGGYDVKIVTSDASKDPRDFTPVNAKDILNSTLTLQSRHWFSDAQIYRWLVDSMLRHAPDYDIENIREDDEIYIALQASLHGATLLMANGAKYYGINVDGVTANKGVLVDQYRTLYNTLRERLGDVRHNIIEGRLVKPSHGTGHFSPASQVKDAIPVRLLSGDVLADDATLTWTQSTARDFYCYEIWRDDEFVAEEQNRFTCDYIDEDLDDGTYVYKIRTVISMSVNRHDTYPTEVPSNQRKYADSKTLTVVIDTA